MVKIYYWPFLGRAGAPIRMLAEAGVEFEHVSEMGEMAGKCAAFGSEAGTIAPPIFEDGDYIVSQSTAVTMHVGAKYGFDVPDAPKANQIMEDIKDLFENGLTKNCSDAKTLKAYLEGADGKPGRFTVFAGAIERNVQGPYFFGDKMTYVDFYWANAVGLFANSLKKIGDKMGGKDLLDPYPKLHNIAKTIRDLESVKKLNLIDMPEQYDCAKDEMLEELGKL